MKTYQEFEAAKEKGQELEFIKQAVNEYKDSEEYHIALDADEYEAERNVTILSFIRWLYNDLGQKVEDYVSANNKVASNFFHRLTTQRVAYSLGNGIYFNSRKRVYRDGEWVTIDETKDKLGKKFDNILYKAGKYARIHGCSYLFWNMDHAQFFKMTEFCPLYDEENGALMAGIRFWSLDWDKKPVTVVLYEQDGYTKYRTKKDAKGMDLVEYQPKRAYKQKVAHNEVDPDEIIGESNYSALPIIPFWGCDNHQSDLVGMRSKIDVFDLVTSGFANDLEDCQEIFWIVGNALGTTDADLAKFRDKLKLQHMAVMDSDNATLTPYKEEIPVTARNTLIATMRNLIYEDYGGLDVHTIQAGATNDHVDAGYQPMDEEADDFEYQVIVAVQGILDLLGVDDVPIFQRNRISNKSEQTKMVMMAAEKLDDETIIRKLPFITPDEVEDILARKLAQEQAAFMAAEAELAQEMAQETPEEQPEV